VRLGTAQAWIADSSEPAAAAAGCRRKTACDTTSRRKHKGVKSEVVVREEFGVIEVIVAVLCSRGPTPAG
jgi:hypothetical protein